DGARGREGDPDADDARPRVGGAQRGGVGAVILERAGELAARGEPFVLATVVRVERPASARRGDRALVLADGTLEGWVGGACSEPIVVREALRALSVGDPVLVRIGPRGSVSDDPDVVAAESMCASEGVVE